MNPCAASVIALRPIAGTPPLMVREPLGEKKAATLAASWLHQAAVYRAAKSRSRFNLSCAINDLRYMRPLDQCVCDAQLEPGGLIDGKLYVMRSPFVRSRAETPMESAEDRASGHPDVAHGSATRATPMVARVQRALTRRAAVRAPGVHGVPVQTGGVIAARCGKPCALCKFCAITSPAVPGCT